MPKTLIKSNYTKGKHWRILLSDDWNSRTPWQSEGTNLPYIVRQTIFTITGQTRLDVIYLGPFAFIKAKLVA